MSSRDNCENNPLVKINLGCGKDIREGWINVDIANIHGFDFGFSSVEQSAYIDFEKSSGFFYNKWLERWVNKSRRRQQMFESTGLSRLFPAQNIRITYKK